MLFFFNDTATTEIYTLSLHDALPIFREIFFARTKAVHGASQVVTTVTYALDLTDFTQHGAHFLLRIVAQMGVTYLVEILGYLYFHVVADTLVLLYTAVELAKGLTLFRVEQLHYHAKHALNTLAKRAYLLLSLEHRELRSLHDTHLDEA